MRAAAMSLAAWEVARLIPSLFFSANGSDAAFGSERGNFSIL